MNFVLETLKNAGLFLLLLTFLAVCAGLASVVPVLLCFAVDRGAPGLVAGIGIPVYLLLVLSGWFTLDQREQRSARGLARGRGEYDR